jgi:hypothetical protein
MDPYRGIIKSRPKPNKQNYDRFIVLGDADPQVVEQRVTELMKKNQKPTIERAKVRRDSNEKPSTLEKYKHVPRGEKLANHLIGEYSRVIDKLT